MAEFQAVIKERDRMCKKHSTRNECPLWETKGNALCGDFVFNNPEKAEKIIMEWSAKTPPITNAAKFKEVFGFDFQDAFGSYGRSEWLDAEYKENGEHDEQWCD